MEGTIGTDYISLNDYAVHTSELRLKRLVVNGIAHSIEFIKRTLCI